MGFAITWCAVREVGADQLLERLGLSPTGEREESPESLIVMAVLDTGWRVLWYNEYGCPFLRPEDLGALSSEQDILLCLVEEHVMAGSSELWSGGARKWRIAHEGEQGPKGIDAEGELPSCFPTIRAEMEEAQRTAGGDQADVDYLFEIPLQVAKSLVGFKHDEDCPHLAEKPFVVLSRPAAKKGFLSRLMGS